MVGPSNNSLQSNSFPFDCVDSFNSKKDFLFSREFQFGQGWKRNEFQVYQQRLRMFHAAITVWYESRVYCTAPGLHSIEYANENILSLLYMILIGFLDAIKSDAVRYRNVHYHSCNSKSPGNENV